MYQFYSDRHGDAPTLNQRLQRRHLSPVKDVKIFLRGTPKKFLSTAFYREEHVQPHCIYSTSKVVDFGGDDFPVATQDGQSSHLNQPGFHPTPICKRYGVGIPAASTNVPAILPSHLLANRSIPTRSIALYLQSIRPMQPNQQLRRIAKLAAAEAKAASLAKPPLSE